MVDERKTENARRSDRIHRQQFRPNRRRVLQFCHPTLAAVCRFVTLNNMFLIIIINLKPKFLYDFTGDLKFQCQ